MLKTFTLSVVLGAMFAATASAALAAPRRHSHTPTHPRSAATALAAFAAARHSQAPTRLPITGAEWWQDRGIADEMGSVYRDR